MRQAQEKRKTSPTYLLPCYLIWWFNSTFLKACLSPTKQWKTKLNTLANPWYDTGKRTTNLSSEYNSSIKCVLGIPSLYCKNCALFKSKKKNTHHFWYLVSQPGNYFFRDFYDLCFLNYYCISHHFLRLPFPALHCSNLNYVNQIN